MRGLQEEGQGPSVKGFASRLLSKKKSGVPGMTTTGLSNPMLHNDEGAAAEEDNFDEGPDVSYAPSSEVRAFAGV